MRYYIFIVSYICLVVTNIALAQANKDGTFAKGPEVQIVSELLMQTKPLLKSQKLVPPKGLTEVKEIANRVETLRRQNLQRFGGVDTGGGTLVSANGHVGLLDLYLYNSKVWLDEERNPSNIRLTNAFELLGFELVNNAQNPIMQKTISQVEKWQISSPILVKELLRALRAVPLYYHNGKIETSPIEYFIPQNFDLKSAQLKLVAFYSSQYGVHIGYDDFQGLPEKHQIALFIHETLRFMNTTGKFNFSNENIQKITATLMNEPSVYETLDRDEYLGGKVLSLSLERYYIIKKIEILSNKICESEDYSPKLFCKLQSQDLSYEEYLERFMKNRWAFARKGKFDTQDAANIFHEVSLLGLQIEALRLRGEAIEADYKRAYLEITNRSIKLNKLIESANRAQRE